MEEQEKFEELKNQKLKLQDPFQTLCNFGNRISDYLDEATEPLNNETLEKLYEDEKAEIKKQMLALTQEFALLDPVAKRLLRTAKRIINPEI